MFSFANWNVFACTPTHTHTHTHIIIIIITLQLAMAQTHAQWQRLHGRSSSNYCDISTWEHSGYWSDRPRGSLRTTSHQESYHHLLRFLAHSANLPEGIYILLALISSFFNMSKVISVSTGPIFTIFSPNGRYLREVSRSRPVLPISEGTLPWQLILWQNYLPPCIYCSGIPKQNGISPPECAH